MYTTISNTMAFWMCSIYFVKWLRICLLLQIDPLWMNRLHLYIFWLHSIDEFLDWWCTKFINLCVFLSIQLCFPKSHIHTSTAKTRSIGQIIVRMSDASSNALMKFTKKLQKKSVMVGSIKLQNLLYLFWRFFLYFYQMTR